MYKSGGEDVFSLNLFTGTSTCNLSGIGGCGPETRSPDRQQSDLPNASLTGLHVTSSHYKLYILNVYFKWNSSIRCNSLKFMKKSTHNTLTHNVINISLQDVQFLNHFVFLNLEIEDQIMKNDSIMPVTNKNGVL